jgi:hypothetical protein
MAAPDQHVRIALKYTKDKEIQFQALGDSFTSALGGDVYDGWSTDGQHFQYFFYGADAKAILARALPLIGVRLRPGGYALLRLGGADDGQAVTTRVGLDAGIHGSPSTEP